MELASDLVVPTTDGANEVATDRPRVAAVPADDKNWDGLRAEERRRDDLRAVSDDEWSSVAMSSTEKPLPGLEKASEASSRFLRRSSR